MKHSLFVILMLTMTLTAQLVTAETVISDVNKIQCYCPRRSINPVVRNKQPR